jgi:hypothetical protein
MENIIEYVDIPDFTNRLADMFNNVSGLEPLSYVECGAKSWTLGSNSKYEIEWKKWLEIQRSVHAQLCPLATGFNFNPTNKHTVPPHIDIDEPKYFNLLIPVFGYAKLSLFETVADHLEFRHGMMHWKMVQDQHPKTKIGEFVVDKPVLLDTNILHDVVPVISPRCVWCSRWVNIDNNLNFKTFKKHVEETLNAI